MQAPTPDSGWIQLSPSRTGYVPLSASGLFGLGFFSPTLKTPVKIYIKKSVPPVMSWDIKIFSFYSLPQLFQPPTTVVLF